MDIYTIYYRSVIVSTICMVGMFLLLILDKLGIFTEEGIAFVTENRSMILISVGSVISVSILVWYLFHRRSKKMIRNIESELYYRVATELTEEEKRRFNIKF